MQHGEKGFISKSAPINELKKAINTVFSGESWLGALNTFLDTEENKMVSLTSQ